GGVHINTMTGSRQQKPRIGLTKCPDLVDHYKDVLGISLKRSHIYEMIAAAYGYSTYASLQADAILLSHTKWQVALDVSAIEARAIILGISIPELVAQKLATSLVQAGIISLRVKEILRNRLNDDYITQLHIKSNQIPPNSTTAREGANKRGNSSRLTQSFHFFSLSRSFLP
ncbi:hypothetical protein ACW5W6_21725, partial [Aeromonas mytilicola]